MRFSLCVMKILWRRKWQPTPVFMPGKSHGQRSLMGSQSWTRLSEHVQSQVEKVWATGGVVESGCSHAVNVEVSETENVEGLRYSSLGETLAKA